MTAFTTFVAAICDSVFSCCCFYGAVMVFREPASEQLTSGLTKLRGMGTEVEGGGAGVLTSLRSGIITLEPRRQLVTRPCRPPFSPRHFSALE